MRIEYCEICAVLLLLLWCRLLLYRVRVFVVTVIAYVYSLLSDVYSRVGLLFHDMLLRSLAPYLCMLCACDEFQ